MEINYLAVSVCAIASIVVGYAWYGPFFGKFWIKEVMGAESMTPEQIAAAKKNMWVMYVIQIILSAITAGVLALHIAYWSDPSTSALIIALCTWFGFVMTTNGGVALWSGKPKAIAWKMFFISAGAQLVNFAVYGIILGMWK